MEPPAVLKPQSVQVRLSDHRDGSGGWGFGEVGEVDAAPTQRYAARAVRAIGFRTLSVACGEVHLRSSFAVVGGYRRCAPPDPTIGAVISEKGGPAGPFVGATQSARSMLCAGAADVSPGPAEQPPV